MNTHRNTGSRRPTRVEVDDVVDHAEPGEPGIEDLRNAYRDAVDRGALGAIALDLARALAAADDPEAADWYRRAVECPPWDDPHGRGTSWVQAAASYALWAHGHGNVDLCAAWAFRLMESAAYDGPLTRAFMASEYKTYRDDWQLASGDEAARLRAMRHLVTEHDLPAPVALDIALLMSSSRWLGGANEQDHADRDAILAALGDERPVSAARAWATIRWVLADAVPAALRLAGLDEEATDIGRRVPADLRRAAHDARDSFGDDDPLDDVSATVAELRHRLRSETPIEAEGETSRRTKGLVIDALERAGLGEQRSAWHGPRGGYEEDEAGRGPGEDRWRLMRGSRAWLEMYAATAASGEAEDWIRWWDRAGNVLAVALETAAWSIGRELGTDLTRAIPYGAPFRRRWAVLVEAFAPSFTSFTETASPWDGPAHGA